jgi:CheY-like chemotaxis protein
MCVEGPAPHEATVLVAVSSPGVREAMVAMIGALEGFRVVGEATTADQALQLARCHRPALAVVDDDLDQCSGTWTIRQLRGEDLAQAVIAIGWRGNGDERARAAGALLDREVQTRKYGRLANLADPFGNGFCLLEMRGSGYDELVAPF